VVNDSDNDFLKDIEGFDLKSLDRAEKQYRVPPGLILGLAKGEITQREALGVSDESLQNVARYGQALLEHEQYEAAAHLFDGLIHVDPNVPYFHLGLGAALKSLGQAQAAIDVWQIARRLDPQDITPHVNLAQAYLDGGDKDQARQLLEEARRLDPQGRQPAAAALKRLWVAHFEPA
jgi:FimV-like protein